ncbi:MULTISPECIES: hypothetical protein [Gluconobacter]|uniref:Uncharacterized protein n=1 Tax=Gluconobacter cerinus TaxID=38307 RepID=A0A1B6VML4_9PROT|nr:MULTISPECIES: hypothetical protein [Gluconobacter]MBS0993753.1 hypothetical protein [Gluconobacter cerinus]MBS1017850.1 hypothetical protein [Gluconobacter cerinus]MBS1021008.1 hypothetical protein [Gluconobacter cerinus]MBS1030010.1 hypothetical protein [Gluconobacter cerinus]MBS1034534.1 hypothetical protein [Gluconobacter cerinus]
MTASLLRPILPLLVVAALGAFTPSVAHHVTSFLGLPGIFWASVMLTLEIVLLCIGLAAVRPSMTRPSEKLYARETVLR